MKRSDPREHVVVVGASAAGVTAVDTLRTEGFEGRITLIGKEPTAAYHRPALSKAFLAGRESVDDILLLPLSCEVDLRHGVEVRSIDPERRRVVLEDGDEIAYDGLVVASGARARRLADLGAADAGIRERVVRDLSDVQDLDAALHAGSRVLILGAGVLGMELASVCADRGADVTVLDRQPPLMAQLGPWLSERVTHAAQDNSVRCEVDPGGVRLRGTPESPVVEFGGRTFEGDLVLSAVGCQPNTEWLHGLGIDLRDGLPVDAWGRFDRDIVAAGDVAAYPDGRGGHRRTPLWNSALEQARTAAKSLLYEDAAPLSSAQYFWTELFGLTIRACGRLPALGAPQVLKRSDSGGELLQFSDADGPYAAAAINLRAPIGRLRSLAGVPAPSA